MGGALKISIDNALADTSAVSVGASGTLTVAGTDTVGSISGAAGSAIGLEDGSILTAGDTTTSFTFAGAMTGTGGFTKIGTGRLNFVTGANTFSGTATVTAGTLALGSTSSLTSAANVSVGSNGTADVNADITVRNISGTGVIDIASSSTLSAGSEDSTVFNGTIQGTSGNFTKVGTGSLTLAGTGTNTGTVAVSAGTLIITGARCYFGYKPCDCRSCFNFKCSARFDNWVNFFSGNRCGGYYYC